MTWTELTPQHPSHPWESWKNRANKPKSKPIIDGLLEKMRARKARGVPITQVTDDEDEDRDSDSSRGVKPKPKSAANAAPSARKTGVAQPPVASTSRKRKAPSPEWSQEDPIAETDEEERVPAPARKAARRALEQAPSQSSDAGVEAALLRQAAQTTFPSPKPAQRKARPAKAKAAPAPEPEKSTSPPLHSSPPPVAGPSRLRPSSATPRPSQKTPAPNPAPAPVAPELEDAEMVDAQFMEDLVYAASGDTELARRAFEAFMAELDSQQPPEVIQAVSAALWTPDEDELVINRRSAADPKPARRTDEDIRDRRRYLKKQDQARIGDKSRFPWS